MTENAQKLYEEWAKEYISNKRFIPMYARRVKGAPMIIFYCEEDEMPWSVQYRGNGHYFKTKEETLEYAKSRGWKE